MVDWLAAAGAAEAAGFVDVASDATAYVPTADREADRSAVAMTSEKSRLPVPFERDPPEADPVEDGGACHTCGGSCQA